MSALGAFVESELSAFIESELKARGSGGEAEYTYWIAIGANVYYWRDGLGSWVGVSVPADTPTSEPQRKLIWHNGELWISGDNGAARTMSSEIGADFGSSPTDDEASDMVVFGTDLLIYAGEKNGELNIYKYNPSTDAWDADTENFNRHAGTATKKGGFAELSGTLYVGGGPPDVFSIEDRGGSAGTPIVPSVQTTPIVKHPGYTADPSIKGVTLGSKIIWSGWGLADDTDSDPDTTFKSTLVEFTGTEGSVDTIVDTKNGGQYKWQTSETWSAIEVFGLDAYAAGADYNGTSRSEGLLKTDGATISMPLTCTTGEVLALHDRGDGTLLIGGDFTDFDENTGTAADRLALWDGAVVTAWPDVAPPLTAGITAILAVQKTGNDPAITNPGLQSADDSPSWTLALSGTDTTKWRLVETDGATGMTINTSTGELSWPSPTPQIGLFPWYDIRVYAGNDQFFDIVDFDLWIASVAPTITAIGAETQASGTNYNEVHTLDAGDGYLTYSVVSHDLPSAPFVTPNGIARTSFRVQTLSPPPDGTYNITVRATNPEGFDDEAFTIEWS